MQWDNVKTQLTDLTENQAQLFKTVLNGGTASVEEAGLSGHGMGRVASSLEEKGLIEPMGRSGRQYKWRPTADWANNWKKYQTEMTYVLDMITQQN